MNGYVAGGWGATAALVIVYAWRTIRRGKVLARRSAPNGEKTWR
ncbi:MAG TPA: hypothetical protein VNF71_06375 [Acidimicrobiales bacterium]|nr:hypothetical protein [Acidimicrobiales bacterium]